MDDTPEQKLAATLSEILSLQSRVQTCMDRVQNVLTDFEAGKDRETIINSGRYWGLCAFRDGMARADGNGGKRQRFAARDTTRPRMLSGTRLSTPLPLRGLRAAARIAQDDKLQRGARGKSKSTRIRRQLETIRNKG